MAKCEGCNGRGFIVGSAPIDEAVPGANNDAWCQVMRCDECDKFEGDTTEDLLEVFLDKSQIEVPIIIAHSIFGDTYLWVNRSVLQRMSHKI
jgi:hypothetical protein